MLLAHIMADTYTRSYTAFRCIYTHLSFVSWHHLTRLNNKNGVNVDSDLIFVDACQSTCESHQTSCQSLSKEDKTFVESHKIEYHADGWNDMIWYTGSIFSVFSCYLLADFDLSTVMLTEWRFFPPEEKNVRIFVVTSVGALELRKKNCKVHFLELLAVYGKILQFLQENVTIFNRKVVKFSYQNRKILQ